MNKNHKELLRSLPKVDECLLILLPYLTENQIPSRIAKRAVRESIEQVRQAILAEEPLTVPQDLDDWTALFTATIKTMNRANLRRLINGAGIIVHTNLGRSLLSREATERLTDAAAHYTNLEFDLNSGTRGSRYSLVEGIICDLTGAEAALVVNNNAAAVFIALETLAGGREVIVSRGQLVEIGGSFRIPDVMAKSGARLVEVGATNRTHRYDYEQAITENTGLLLRVHTSNFRVIGFTSEVSARELVELGEERGIAVMEDLGSGCLMDMTRFGLPAEPTVQDVLSAGVDVVTFSGDKLLGGPQAGLIVGKKQYIDKIKKNPLNRALRIDKFTLAALESILREYYDPETALTTVPTLRMISESPENTKKRGRRLLRRLGRKLDGRCGVKLAAVESKVGGGSLPEYSLQSWALELRPGHGDVNRLERAFRALPVPLIGRIDHDRFLLDCRTIQDQEIPEVADILISLF